MPKMRTPEEFDTTVPSGILRVSPYAGQNVLCTFRCLSCKHEWTTKAVRVRRGCYECKKKTLVNGNQKNPKDYPKELAKANPELKALEVYVNAYTSILHRHTVCGHEWKAKPLNTLRGKGCPKCKLRLKSVSLGKKDVLVQGYEDKALTLLLQKFKPSQIHVQKENTVPTFSYKFRGSVRRYFPDMYIPSKKCIIEVKSLCTIGLLGNMYSLRPSELFYMTREKAKTVMEEGYKFELMVMLEDGSRLKLPKDWSSMNFREFKSSVQACSTVRRR